MQLSVLMTVYNEADFVDYAIRACLPHVDNLVIVEGAYQETIRLNKSPRSTDGTCEIVEKYKDHPKVSIIYANEESDKDQRNVGLNKIKELNPDGWLLIIDGDECWTEATLLQVKKLMQMFDKQGIKACYFQSLTFVNDLEHYTNQEFPRLFKITQDCTFTNDNFMKWGNLGWNSPHVMKYHLKYFHYSFVKSKERFNTKRDWWMHRGLGKDFDYGWHMDDNGRIYDAGHKIFKFTGKHPEIIKDHPLMKKQRKEKTLELINSLPDPGPVLAVPLEDEQWESVIWDKDKK
jgi:glycosyltransferase involved in cell wall biosynthesis